MISNEYRLPSIDKRVTNSANLISPVLLGEDVLVNDLLDEKFLDFLLRFKNDLEDIPNLSLNQSEAAIGRCEEFLKYLTALHLNSNFNFGFQRLLMRSSQDLASLLKYLTPLLSSRQSVPQSRLILIFSLHYFEWFQNVEEIGTKKSIQISKDALLEHFLAMYKQDEQLLSFQDSSTEFARLFQRVWGTVMNGRWSELSLAIKSLSQVSIIFLAGKV